MRKLDDGSFVVIRRSQTGFPVEHIAANGIVADTMDCDTFAEARAALAFGPARW